ncbi:MAG: AzlC family ABC transporter permease [Candidatus Puniceispirillales bacterium WSBS_2018_MAG_OTU23]
MANNSHTTARQEFWAGICAEAPLMLGVVPFGVVFGVLGLAAGLPPIIIMAMSVIIFGGASQIAFTQLVTAGASGVVIASTVGIINLRHVLYSATLTNYLDKTPIGWGSRVLIAYLLTDEAFFISLSRMQTQPYSPNMHFHMLGSGALLWASWQASTFAGIVLGAEIPPSLNLEFAIPLTFMAIIIPHLTTIASTVAVVVAGLAAVMGQNLPWNIWIIAAACLGIAAGYGVELIFCQKDLTKKDSKP